MRLHLLVPAAALLLASCASTASPSVSVREGHAILGDFNKTPHTYEASASGSVWQPANRELENGKDYASWEPAIEIRSRTMVLTGAQVIALVGDARMGAWTIRASLAEVQEAFAPFGGHSMQMMTLHANQEGQITTQKQTAFVESFQMVASSTHMIADPVVAVASEGSLLRATGTPVGDSGSVRVVAQVELHELASPIATHEVQVPGATTPVSVQLPVTTHQMLSFTEVLSPDEAIVGALPVTGDPTRMNIFVLTAIEREGPKVAVLD